MIGLNTQVIFLVITASVGQLALCILWGNLTALGAIVKESELLKKIQLAASKLGYRLFRNNVAKGWIGKTEYITHTKTITVYPGDKIIRQARRLNSGLCVGSSDLIGWKLVTINESLLGSQVAQFTAFEAKTGKLKATEDQQRFIDAVNRFGGFARVIHEEEDIGEILKP